VFQCNGQSDWSFRNKTLQKRHFKKDTSRKTLLLTTSWQAMGVSTTVQRLDSGAAHRLVSYVQSVVEESINFNSEVLGITVLERSYLAVLRNDREVFYQEGQTKLLPSGASLHLLSKKVSWI
jgi:hypothetical protein